MLYTCTPPLSSTRIQSPHNRSQDMYMWNHFLVGALQDEVIPAAFAPSTTIAAAAASRCVGGIGVGGWIRRMNIYV